MNLSRGQEEALASVRELQAAFPEGGGVLVISGPAGTGKTTCLKTLAETEGDGFFVLTPTGKAATRVREAAGCEGLTIHRWAYSPIEDEETGEVAFRLRDVEDLRFPEYGYVVVDEASMVSLDLFRDLYAYTRQLKLNLVMIGDGFQLPPVDSGTGFSVFSSDFPAWRRIDLTEIFRQALDSPIIRASVCIRESRYPEDALRDLEVIADADVPAAIAETWEQGTGVALCYRNASRHLLNQAARAGLGYKPGSLTKGEPLLVVKNEYGLELYNGEVLAATGVRGFRTMAITDRHKNASAFVNYLRVDAAGQEAVVCEQEVFGTLGEVGAHVARREAQKAVRATFRDTHKEDRPKYLHANLGYALTCHKAQGSEWPEVLVGMDDSIRIGTPEGRRWAYTAITRARSRVRLFSTEKFR